MKIQYVSIKPTQKADELGCHALIPEMLASTGARYSRNNEGLDAILAKVDVNNQEKSIDTIFRHTDYGHASILGMVPIALFIDEISQFAAYYLWTLAPQADGQECSTRYIKMDSSGVVDADTLGIPENLKEEFNNYNTRAFNFYEEALKTWSELSNLHPEATKIPKYLLDSDTDKDKKAVARMKRNYAFDRARVYIPLASKTGVMMIQSARAWANISAHLQASNLKELRLIGQGIAEQMSIGAPRLLKHTKPTEAIKKYQEYERKQLVMVSEIVKPLSENETHSYFDVEDLQYPPGLMASACEFRTNRYSPFGSIVSRTSVKFSWEGISFGEIRDLNRHRTGTKYCPLLPLGFYGATDQLTHELTDVNLTSKIKDLYNSFQSTTEYSRSLLKDNPEYIYFTSLGHKYYFEHTTTADKFLYEMELRTGVGAHYKYAEHCRETLSQWFERYPETKGLIYEGSAEPE